MTTEGFKRRLTTMFSADVAGYSCLMAEDEAETVKTLTAYRGIMAELIKQHRGQVVDSPGDNVLAEFTSVFDCCAHMVLRSKVLLINKYKAIIYKRMANLYVRARIKDRLVPTCMLTIQLVFSLKGNNMND